jgi:hypothetical protein
MKAITLALATALALMPQPARSAGTPARLETMEYLKARKLILSYGWVPARGDCSGPDVDAHICATYPEIGNCTGVGIGYCDMTFKRRAQCLYLVTIGGAPKTKRETPRSATSDSRAADAPRTRGPEFVE